MIGYITIGTNNFAAASQFYDSLFTEINASRIMDEETYIVWGQNMESTGFTVMRPHDGNQASVGNGSMVALSARKTEKVNALYQKALSLGGSCEGKPGHRGGGFYAAYFRDLDGNKLNAYCLIDESHPEYG